MRNPTPDHYFHLLKKDLTKLKHFVHKKWKEFMALPDGERRSKIIITGIATIIILAILNTLPIDKEEICIQNKGKWLADSNECENITEAVCRKMDGKYTECASPCRNNSSASACIQRCVKVCMID